VKAQKESVVFAGCQCKIMSLSSAQILTVITAIHDKCALATNVDYVFPTGTRFSSKEDFWTFADSTKTKQSELETNLVNAVWISYLRFEDDDSDSHSPVKTIHYELTLFTESTFERLDETDNTTFNAKVSKTEHEHDTSVFSLQTQFQGVDDLGLDTSIFAVSETKSLVQIDNTQREIPCEFIQDNTVIGSVSKFDCAVRIQPPC
jgi:hypothetical protein